MEVLIPNILTDSEIVQILDFAAVSFHHDDDGGHSVTCKPNHLPAVAERAFARMTRDLPHTFQGVDPWMKFYRLGGKANGTVLPHMDEDFRCPNGHLSTWSVLFYLGGDYEGGETVFEGSRVISHPDRGSVLVFPHKIIHEGKPVINGTKFVLKTDLY